jgi:hypothetical protein
MEIHLGQTSSQVLNFKVETRLLEGGDELPHVSPGYFQSFISFVEKLQETGDAFVPSSLFFVVQIDRVGEGQVLFERGQEFRRSLGKTDGMMKDDTYHENSSKR